MGFVAASGCDRSFPLLTNGRSRGAEQVWSAYMPLPLVVTRLSQLKTDFAVAPVYLKNVARIQGLLAVYFLVLMTQTLLERELRRAMAQAGVPSLPLYPEGRPCSRPTTQRLLELFAPIQRHEIRCSPNEGGHSKHNPDELADDDRIMVSKLTPVQRKILKLLNLSATDYGR